MSTPVTGYKVKTGTNVYQDLGELFQAIRGSTQVSATGYKTPSGVDINTLFEPKSTTSSAVATGYMVGSTDLNTLFDAYGTSYTIYSGPSVTTYTNVPGFDHVLVFTAGTTYAPITFSVNTYAYIVMVAGGGGGGLDAVTYESGGGGAGGVAFGYVTFSANSAITISVGAGGAVETNGGDTSISGGGVSEQVIGGGHGGSRSNSNEFTSVTKGATGGSGGGNAGMNGGGLSDYSMGSGVLLHYGHNGGRGDYGVISSSGGGGGALATYYSSSVNKYNGLKTGGQGGDGCFFPFFSSNTSLCNFSGYAFACGGGGVVKLSTLGVNGLGVGGLGLGGGGGGRGNLTDTNSNYSFTATSASSYGSGGGGGDLYHYASGKEGIVYLAYNDSTTQSLNTTLGKITITDLNASVESYTNGGNTYTNITITKKNSTYSGAIYFTGLAGRTAYVYVAIIGGGGGGGGCGDFFSDGSADNNLSESPGGGGAGLIAEYTLRMPGDEMWSIDIGKGGNGGTTTVAASNGTDTQYERMYKFNSGIRGFAPQTAYGGGSGGGFLNYTDYTPGTNSGGTSISYASGGGGGARSYNATDVLAQSAATVINQNGSGTTAEIYSYDSLVYYNNAGGNGQASGDYDIYLRAGGGGGGAGGPGENGAAVAPQEIGGNGGSGRYLNSSYFSQTTMYGGGGGGSGDYSSSSGGLGGSSIGGNSGNINRTVSGGVANTGSGGGAAALAVLPNGGAGADGAMVISILSSIVSTSNVFTY
jgi:hypothetical protein